MNQETIMRYLFIVFWIWFLGVAAASVVYRWAHGKPVLFFGVPNAVYQTRFGSGYSHRTWSTKLGGARSCLVVAVAAGRLIIRPLFPANLFFFPEKYGLEFEVPIESILAVTSGQFVLRSTVEVEFHSASGRRERVTLYVRHLDRFLSALKPSQPFAGAVGA